MSPPQTGGLFNYNYLCTMNIQELYQLYLQYPSVQTDTRKLQPNDLFFALKGPHFNGNAFAKQALAAGATYAIIDEQEHYINERTILVEDALETLQALAKFHRQQFSIPFLAITGSNGKTTTKELVHVVLSTSFKTYTTEGNLNNHIGVPLTILKIKRDAHFAIIEMGANHQKEIDSYCQIALPTHGLITNCGKAHLEGFGSEEGIRKGKGELFDYLRQHGGTAFIMQDYPYLHDMSKGIKNIITYGTEAADVVGNIQAADPLLQVHFTKGFQGTINTSLVGGYNLPNVLAAVAVGKSFGITDENIKKAIEAYTPSNSRSQLVVKGTNKIIVDAYNANPSSMKAAIDNFARTANGHKILVLGAMAELGADSLQEHREIVNQIQQHQWQNVLLVGGDFEKLDHPYQGFGSAAEAGAWLGSQPVSNTYFLVKGSRSMQMEKVLDFIKE
jgi:UDP-N-acetylmuramoyl-tripeptide--D-alanyl-D-alanine ligase